MVIIAMEKNKIYSQFRDVDRYYTDCPYCEQFYCIDVNPDESTFVNHAKKCEHFVGITNYGLARFLKEKEVK